MVSRSSTTLKIVLVCLAFVRTAGADLLMPVGCETPLIAHLERHTGDFLALDVLPFKLRRYDHATLLVRGTITPGAWTLPRATNSLYLTAPAPWRNFTTAVIRGPRADLTRELERLVRLGGEVRVQVIAGRAQGRPLTPVPLPKRSIVGGPADWRRTLIEEPGDYHLTNEKAEVRHVALSSVRLGDVELSAVGLDARTFVDLPQWLAAADRTQIDVARAGAYVILSPDAFARLRKMSWADHARAKTAPVLRAVLDNCVGGACFAAPPVAAAYDSPAPLGAAGAAPSAVPVRPLTLRREEIANVGFRTRAVLDFLRGRYARTPEDGRLIEGLFDALWAEFLPGESRRGPSFAPGAYSTIELGGERGVARFDEAWRTFRTYLFDDGPTGSPRPALTWGHLAQRRLQKLGLTPEDLMARWPGVILPSGHPVRTKHPWTLFYTGRRHLGRDEAVVAFVKDNEIKVVEEDQRLVVRFLREVAQQRADLNSGPLILDRTPWSTAEVEVPAMVVLGLRLRHGLSPKGRARSFVARATAGPDRTQRHAADGSTH